MVKPFASYALTRWGNAVILFTVVAVIVMMAAYSYHVINRELTETVLSRRASVSYLAAAVLSEKFDRLIDIGISLASRVRFRELVEAGNWADASKILSSVPADFPFIDRITLNDLGGTMMADIPEASEVRGRNFAHRDWYQAVIRNGQPYISQVYRRAASPPMNVFVAAVPIKGSEGKLLGILVLEVRSDTFFEWTKGIEAGLGGLVYVVDHRGTLAAHPKYPPQGDLVDYSSVPVVQKLLQGNRGVEVYFNPFEKEERVVAYEPIAKHGWGIALAQPTATAFANRDDQLRRVLSAYGLLLVFAYLAFRVVVERRRSHEALVRSEELLRRQATVLQSILDSLGDGVTVIDENLKVQMINPVARRIIGLEPGQPPPADWAAVTGRYLPDMVTPLPTDRLFISRALRGESVDDEEVFIRNRRFPEGLWISCSARPVVSDGVVRQAVVVWHDITERRHADDQIRALNKELEERAALLEASNQELESFSYSVSHDLRSPLRAISGYTRMLEEDHGASLDAEGKRYLTVLHKEAGRMAALIDDLLEFSRLGREEFEAAIIDMTALASEVAEELRPTAVPGTEIQVDLLPPGLGDRLLLRQVWINLLGNAIKYSSKRDQPRIHVSGTEGQGEASYHIEDNGAGFDMRHYNKLFGVFQRLHSFEEFTGTGIGLAIVHRVVTRHGGRVWAEGEVGRGAVFHFSLPAGKIAHG